MIEKLTDSLVRELTDRSLPEGGFSNRTGGQYHTEATAWAVYVLSAIGGWEDIAKSGQSRLAADQMEDGRVSLSAIYPQAFWPTPLAVIAWHDSSLHRKSQSRALEFLLKTTGRHFRKKNDFVLSHDTSIRGWPWIENTHSWIEPTSMVLFALELTGYGDHERAKEARRMLLDRQLEDGGWNYGNTRVFGQKLRPMLAETGLALNALAGREPRESVEKSISYLKNQISHLCTPFSLSWSILGLSAWDERPDNAESFILRCLERQEVYGPYYTSRLSLLMASLYAKRGLLSLAA